MGNVASLSVRVTANTGDFDKALGKLEGQWKRTGSRLQGIGSALTVGITVPLVAAAASLTKIGLEFDHAMDTIRSTTGATGASLQGLGASFRTVFAQVPNSMADVATAVGSISVRTGQTGKDLETLSTQTLNLARVTGEQLPGLIASTTRVFGDWSIATTEQSSALDFLYKTSQATGIGVTKLSEVVVQFGAPLRALGFSFKESAAMIGKWEKEGVNLETVLAGLKFGLGNFAKAGLEPRVALQQVQAAIKGAKTESESMSIAIKTFGKRAGPDLARAIIEGRFAIDDLVKSLDASKETINTAAAATLSLDDRFEILKHKVMVAAEPLANQFVQALEGVMNAAMPLAGVLGTAGDAIAAMPAPVHTTAVGLLGMAAAVGPATYIWGGFKTMIGSVIGLMRGLPAVMSAGLAATPIGLLVLGITTAIVSIKQLTGSWAVAFGVMIPPVGLMINEWDRFKEAIKTVWALISNGPSTNPDVPGAAPGWRIPDGLGPSGSIDDAMALLDASSGARLGEDLARLSGKGGGGAGGGGKAKIDELTKAIGGITDSQKRAIIQAKAWNIVIDRQGGLDSATKFAKDQLAGALEEVIRQYGSLEAAGLGSLNSIYEATKKVLESTRAISAEAAIYTGVMMGDGSNMGGLMPNLGMLPSNQNSIHGQLEHRYTSLQDLANQAGMSGAPTATSQNIAAEASAYAADQMASSAKETVDGIRKAFQYFTGSLSGGMAALLGSVMNILEKGAAKGGFLQKLLGGKAGTMIGTGLDVGMGAFGGGFGMGEQFGKTGGALGGAASGALTGAMVAGPFGAVVGGIAGLIGGIFGGAKKKREEQAKMGQTREQLVSDFGGMDNLRKQADLAGVSVDLLFSTTKPKEFQAELDKVGDAIQVMQERIKGTITEIDKVMDQGGLIGADLWGKILQDGGSDEIKAKLAEVFTASVNQSAEGFNQIGQNFELLKAPIEQIGVLADAAFAGMLADGASLPEALAAIAPALDHIQEVMNKSGQQATGPLAAMLAWQGIIQQNQGIFEILSGVDAMLTGLGNSGLLTQARFTALGQTITQAFGNLQAHGVAAGTALELMQPQLQKLWEAQQMFGLKTDAATQSLINQAVQQGLVGEQMKDVNHQILDVLTAIAKVLGADIPGALAGLPGAAQGAASGFRTAFEGMPDIRVGFKADWDFGNMPQPSGPTGGTGSKPTPSIAPSPSAGSYAGRDSLMTVMEGSGVNLNMTVNGTADRDFAVRLAQQIAIGGTPKTVWQGAIR